MQRLSAAFLSDEEQVLASIQQLRHQAEQAGSLAELNNLAVVKEDNIIIFQHHHLSWFMFLIMIRVLFMVRGIGVIIRRCIGIFR